MGIEVRGPGVSATSQVLTKEGLAFVERLHRELNPRREELLAKRAARQMELDAGKEFDFLPETKKVRDSEFKVASCPADLQKRFVEITGPVERKMMINALNSGADVFMADFEDALSPTWSNVVVGHVNLMDAVRKKLAFTSPEGKAYKLNDKIATLLVRPRGWHLPEKHLVLDGQPVSGSLADFGLRSEEHTSELQSPCNLVCRLLLEKKTLPARKSRSSSGTCLSDCASRATQQRICTCQRTARSHPAERSHQYSPNLSEFTILCSTT